MWKLEVINFLSKTFNFLKKIITKNRFLYEVLILNPGKKRNDLLNAPLIKEAIDNLINQKEIPIPAAVEIETYNKCNGDCDFCPINKNLDTREHKFMDENLFYSIISQLKELNFKGYVNCFSNNEPLLDERIFDFVKHIKNELPNATKILFTNGLLLNLDKFLELIPNLDFMVIDHYFEGKLKLRENIAKIAKYVLEHPELKSKVKIQTIDKHAIRNNRGGNSKNRKYVYNLKSSCIYPFSQLIIRPTGQISLCCNDALGQMTMGDLSKERLVDIWRGEKYQEIRNLILKSRQNLSLCKNCDNFGVFGVDKFLDGYKIGQNWGDIEELIKN